MKFYDQIHFFPKQLPECTHQQDGHCTECQQRREADVRRTFELVKELKDLAAKYEIVVVLSQAKTSDAPDGPEHIVGKTMYFNRTRHHPDLTYRVMKNR